MPKHVLPLCRSKIDFLHDSQKHHKNQYNLNILFAHQNSPREMQKKLLSHVWGETDVTRKSCLTSAVVLTKKKSPLRLRVFINREVHVVFFVTPTFSLFEKKVLVAPAPLTISTKVIVRLRCRCSCEMCSTSAAPLLVIHETSIKSS